MNSKANLKNFLTRNGAYLNWEIENEKRGLLVTRWKVGNHVVVVMDHYIKGLYKLVINGEFLPVQKDSQHAIFQINSLCYQN